MDNNVNPSHGVSLFCFYADVCRSGDLLVFGGFTRVVGDSWCRELNCYLLAISPHSCFSREFAQEFRKVVVSRVQHSFCARMGMPGFFYQGVPHKAYGQR